MTSRVALPMVLVEEGTPFPPMVSGVVAALRVRGDADVARHVREFAAAFDGEPRQRIIVLDEGKMPWTLPREVLDQIRGYGVSIYAVDDTGFRTIFKQVNSTLPTKESPIRLFRYSRGKSSNNRPLTGWGYRCPCGYRTELNTGKRETTRYALWHLVQHGLPRSEELIRSW